MKKIILTILAIIALQSLRDGNTHKAETMSCDIGKTAVTLDVPKVYRADFGVSAIIAAGITAAATTAGAVASNQQQKNAQRRMRDALDAEAKRNRQHYDAEYYDNGTQRADNVRALTIAQDKLRRQTQAATGKNAVMGGTNAESAAAKEAANNAYAQAVSNIAAETDSRKDDLKESAFKNEKDINAKKADLQYQADQRHIENIQTAVNAIGQSANAVGSAFSSDGGTTSAKAANGARLKYEVNNAGQNMAAGTMASAQKVANSTPVNYGLAGIKSNLSQRAKMWDSMKINKMR